MWLKFFLLVLVTLPTARAYNLTADFKNGFYWASLPIGITVVENDPVRKAKLTLFSKEAIKEWEKITDLNLWDETNSASSNIIRWSNNFAAETGMDASSVLAIAIRYTGGPYFAKTEIVINGNHSLNQNDVTLLTTIMHELGHTQGLDHSNDWDALMAPTLKMSPEVEIDDKNGMVEAQRITKDRQVTGFVSPLAFEEKTESSQPLSCGTVAVASSTPASGFVSLAIGMLMGFVRKAYLLLKKLF